MGFHPELMTKPQPESFPNLNTTYVGLENKSQMVTEILMSRNKELIEGEGKALEWKHLHSLLPLIPAKGPLIKNQKSPPISLRQELSRPTEMIKNSAGRDAMVALGTTLIPVTSYGYKPENKASQDGLPVDSLIIHPHWPSKTFPLTELPLKPVGIPDRLLASASVQEQKMPWITTKTEKLVWQGDLVITKPSNLYSSLTVQSIRKPQDAVHNCEHLYQSFSHVMLVKGKNFLEIGPGVDESVTGPSNIPNEELSSSLLFNDEQVEPESSATGKGRVGEASPTRDEVSRGVSLDPAQSNPLENIRHLNEQLLDLGSSGEVTSSGGFVWDSVSPSSLTEHSPSLKTPRTALSLLQEVTGSIRPNTGAVHSSAPMPHFKAKAVVPLTPGQVWKNMTADGVLVLTPGYSDAKTTSPSFGNESVFEFQHYPGDILYEVIVEMECQVETPYNASEVEKVLVDSLKQEIGRNLGHFSPEADAFKLTRMERKDTSNVMLIFWLHLRSRERNMPDTMMSQLRASESSALHSQLRTHIRDTVEALQLHLKSTSIHDVNECEIGLEQCGDGAECFNGVGTYMCHCKEDYEDRSPMQTGTLCVHVPHSGVGFSFSYLDLLITVAVFATILLMLLIGFVWLAIRTTQEKRDFCLQETMSLEGVSILPLTQTKACLNLRKFKKYSVYNPYQPKPPATVIDGSLGQIPYLNKDSHVCVEQSECLK
ncbi:uncharacterized protein [Petaurus breviceps papuanus]|uniref:uncharacterized protein n=1 Tax=Petaurus breviceps papuanus TaxID=3040969 RepID=UPI0036D97328